MGAAFWFKHVSAHWAHYYAKNMAARGLLAWFNKSVAHLCVLNPDGPVADTAFVANSHFVSDSLPVGRQK